MREGGGVESYLNTKKPEGNREKGEGLDVSYCNWKKKKTVHEEKLEHRTKMWKRFKK